MQRKDRFESKAFHSNPAGVQAKSTFESKKAFHSNPAGVEGAHLNQKLLLDYRVQGKEKRQGRPLCLFLLGSTFFFSQYLKNVQCSMQNNNPFKLQRLRHFTLNPNGYRMTTMMTMRGKTFCKEEKSGLGNSSGVILSNVLNLGRAGDLVIW